MCTPFPHCAEAAAETGVLTEKTRGVCAVGADVSYVSSDVTHVVGVEVREVTFANTSSQTTWSVVLAGKTVFSQVARAAPFANVVLMLRVGSVGGASTDPGG
jgi:hypothetical protein